MEESIREIREIRVEMDQVVKEYLDRRKGVMSRLGDIVVECHSKAREQRLVKTDPSEIWELIEPLTSQLFDLLKEAYGWEHTAAMHKAYVESIRKVVEWDRQE